MRYGFAMRSRSLMARLALVVLAGVALRPAVGQADAIVTQGPSTCHAVAFTFDLCPVVSGSGFDQKLVSFLITHRVHATFFASGAWIDTHDAELRQLAAQPFFEIGTHGATHAHMPRVNATMQAAELTGAVRTLETRYQRHPTLFRPPYGEYNADTLRVADAAGQKVVMWSIVSGDPDKNLTAEAIEADVEHRVKNGSVMIFHANGRGWRTSEVIPVLYDRLVVKKSFATATITELLGGCSPAK
jgi:hypothetical protein